MFTLFWSISKLHKYYWHENFSSESKSKINYNHWLKIILQTNHGIRYFQSNFWPTTFTLLLLHIKFEYKQWKSQFEHWMNEYPININFQRNLSAVDSRRKLFRKNSKTWSWKSNKFFNGFPFSPLCCGTKERKSISKCISIFVPFANLRFYIKLKISRNRFSLNLNYSRS